MGSVQKLITDEPNFRSPEQAMKILFPCALIHLTKKDNALEFIERQRQKLASTEKMTKVQFNELIAVIWDIFKSFLQSPKDDKSNIKFIKQIVQLSKVSEEFALSLLESLQNERPHLELKFHEDTTTRMSISKISYRFDISMMDEQDATIKPILILDLLLSTGKSLTFRVPYTLFHRLRFSTARLLKEIQFLETRKIISR